jgi:hypothetical protein
MIANSASVTPIPATGDDRARQWSEMQPIALSVVARCQCLGLSTIAG